LRAGAFADITVVTTHARFVGSGVQPLIDAIRDAGGDPGDLRAVVWQATWARGYDDVVAPAPAARLKEQGFVVYTHPIDHRTYATIIDTTRALWALIARGQPPPLGSRVKIVPTIQDGVMGWDIHVVDVLGIGLRIAFQTGPREGPVWAERLQNAINRIAVAEVERRQAIVNERRTIIGVAPVKPFREELDALHEAMRKQVDAETAARPDERAAYERGNEKQRKAIIDEVKRRRVERYNEELEALKARIPELREDHERRLAALAESNRAISELEDAASRSRGITERIALVESRLKEVRESSLTVIADFELLDALGPSDFEDIAHTVELLFDLIPRRTKR
jgi:hypothetical protein